MPLKTLALLVALCAPCLAQESRPASRQAKQGKSPGKTMGWTGVLGEKEFAALHELKQGATPKLHGEMIKVGDTKAYLSQPKGDKPLGAVLVIHEWWGLNNNVKHWADRLAADGYSALAIDLYEGVVATTREDALAAMRGVDGDKALATLQAAHRFLKESPRIAAKKRACVGWCFGGGWSLKLAMAAKDLDAAVIYYGRLVTDADKLVDINAKMLGIFGKKDRGIPMSSVEAFEAAMQKAGKDLTVVTYDANHAFANPSSARYDEKSAAAAWSKVRAFLREHIGAAPQPATFRVAGDKAKCLIPAGWKKAGPRPMRNLNLTAGSGVQCYVTVLPGAAGGISPNLNRWCSQMGAKPLSDEDIAALPRLAMLGRKAVLLDVSGRFVSMRGEVTPDAQMLATICAMAEATVFVKMIGPATLVKAQKKDFERFCESMQLAK